jgi:ribonuclease HI
MIGTMTDVNHDAGDDDRTEVVRRELLLLEPGVRADRRRVRGLLHVEFVEFGASGRVWNAEAMVEALASDSAPVRLGVTDLNPISLSADAVLLTYRIEDSERPSLRSSVWLRNDDGDWLLRFHQGTPAG